MGLADRQFLKAIGLQQARQITDGTGQLGQLAPVVVATDDITE
jgi:hypothetical protein